MYKGYLAQDTGAADNLDIERLMAEARAERARYFRALIARIFRRQALPVWNQTALPAS
ncbi:MAG: hypothetical protein HWE39_14425 [Oceanospirillaceae bacterium]|nr:hypothetical protein [Oceanospirillaceae bacterium]